ncbi:MAG: alpha/beta fold hydrolase [Alphaproteobacteria bacterium]
MIPMPGLPEPDFIRTNGIRMAVYAAGPEDGLPVVLCHGFPELAFSWRHQIPALAEAGYRVLAPDQRGYGNTERPQAVEAYDIHALTGDLAGLLDHYGADRAVFAGHDWGGIVVWQMPLLHPNRVAGVIGLNTPFFARHPEKDPVTLFREAYGPDMYIVRFQERGTPEAVLDADPAKTLRFFLRKWRMSLEDFDKLPAEFKNFALLDAIEGEEDGFGGEPLLSGDEFQVFVNAFRETGFGPGINWYRNFRRNWESTEGVRQQVDAPALMIMADRDYVLPPRLTEGMEQWVPDLERHLVRECGHWTQQEHPQEVNRVMTGWLERRFGKPGGGA